MDDIKARLKEKINSTEAEAVDTVDETVEGIIDASSDLDDVEDEDRKFTVNIEGSRWRFVLGDFPLALEGSKFALFNKEVRGVLAEGHMHDKITSIFLYAQSKGLSRRFDYNIPVF